MVARASNALKMSVGLGFFFFNVKGVNIKSSMFNIMNFLSTLILDLAKFLFSLEK